MNQKFLSLTKKCTVLFLALTLCLSLIPFANATEQADSTLEVPQIDEDLDANDPIEALENKSQEEILDTLSQKSNVTHAYFVGENIYFVEDGNKLCSYQIENQAVEIIYSGEMSINYCVPCGDDGVAMTV